MAEMGRVSFSTPRKFVVTLENIKAEVGVNLILQSLSVSRREESDTLMSAEYLRVCFCHYNHLLVTM